LSHFEVIPAIDLRGGRCVRLYQGLYDKETVYGDDPAAMARHWCSLGAGRLHVVDLDGARSGAAANADAVRAILGAVDVPVELGGGIRDMAAIEGWLDAGVERVYLGTAAVTNPGLVAEACRYFPGRIAAGADARDGRIATRGWEADSGEDVTSFALRMAAAGVTTVAYTSVTQDGTLEGADITGARALIDALQGTGTRLLLAGGIGSLDDVLAAARLPGLAGIIVGRALYEGRVDLAAALAAVPVGSERNLY
jgi:phosphoribosylformimino-5-aminoimidazole carboxamide ribotide isomerase